MVPPIPSNRIRSLRQKPRQVQGKTRLDNFLVKTKDNSFNATQLRFVPRIATQQQASETQHQAKFGARNLTIQRHSFILRVLNRLQAGDSWTEYKNQRRCELIDREIDGVITPLEQIELESLQAQMVRYRQKLAPLPIEYAKKLHAEVTGNQNEPF